MKSQQPTDVPCFRCGGLGENIDEGEDDASYCLRCMGEGADPEIVLWSRPVAGASIYADTTKPCPQCQGGEWGDCGMCLGSGFAVATPPKGGWAELWADCPWSPIS